MLNKKMKLTLVSLSSLVFFGGCTGNKIDVLSYPTKIRDKVTVPEVCKFQYKSVMPTVAVIDFTNNSTFGKASINKTNSYSNTRKNYSAVAGLVATNNAFGLGVDGQKNINKRSQNTNVKRNIDPKLSSTVTGALESIISKSGGAQLFTRSEMDKIDAELKFQDSGLIDPKSAVKFGKTSGVKFILTGSIDNVEQNYRGNSKAANHVHHVTAKEKNDSLKYIGALLALGTSLTDGMLISSKITIKLLDVETGKIVFSKQLADTVNIGKIRNPNYDQIIGGIKAAMINSLPSLENDLAIYFKIKGYITQLKVKNSDVIAQVNIGSNFKVTENQLFKVYALEENEDPITGVITCDVIETSTQLRATQQIRSKSTWTTVEGGNPSLLKLGQLVQKTQEKAGFEIPTF